MDIFDKNTQPFVTLGDRHYIPKLKRIDGAVNKLIDEFVSAQGVENNILSSIETMLTTAIEDRISFGEGLYGDYDHPVLTIGIGEPVLPAGLSGDFLVLGSRPTNQTVEVVAGVLPVLSTMFNLTTGEAETIYQRYRILNSSNEEMISFCGFAIDGDYMICGEVEDFGSGRNIAISPYNADEGIRLEASWISNDTIKDGVGINLIDVGLNYVVLGVVMIKPGKFAILTSYAGQIDEYIVKVVTYTSPTVFTVDNIICSISAAGVSDCLFNSPAIRIAVDIDTFELAVSIDIQNQTSFQDGSIIFTIDTESNAVTDFSVGLSSTSRAPLGGLASINERCFEMELMSYYYRTCSASFGGIKLASSTQSYGGKIEYKEYTSRSITGFGYAEYADLSEVITILSSVVLPAKFATIGYPFDSPENSCTFGALSGYII